MKCVFRDRVAASIACALLFLASTLALAGPSATTRSASASPTQTPTGVDGGVWHAFGGLPEGCAGNIDASALAPNGYLYVGGSFPACGDKAVSFVARWDGTTWSSLGTGVDSAVHAMAVSGGDLYVGGQIHSAGGVAVSGIARWDGSQWHALGDGVGGAQGGFNVYSIAVVGNDVYVGGYFDSAGGAPANSIARWNTTTQTWSPLGAGLTQGGFLTTVYALASLNGVLHAGGNFEESGATTLSHVGAWNGTSWAPVGDGFDQQVYALAAWNGSLYAGGLFNNSGANSIRHLSRWNGTAWVTVGAGTNRSVRALAGSLLGLFVGGTFSEAGGNPFSNIALWNGSAWSDVSGGIDGALQARVVNTITGGLAGLYVGGQFASAGGGTLAAHGIVAWNGTAWSALDAPAGKGLYSSPVSAVTYAGKPCFGGYGELYPVVGALACWNGVDWEALGGSLANNIASDVGAMVVHGSDLYLGGYVSLGSDCCIGRWDGSTWNALGDGVDSQPTAIAVDGTHVYAAGYFEGASGVMVNHVAMWDGAAWTALGGGIDDAPITLAFYQGKLYAGGYFTDADGVPASYIAAWDGTSWAAVGGGLDGQVNALTVSGGSLYASGYFGHAGVLVANSIARWDGTQWHAVTTPLGNGFTYLGAYGFVGTLVDTPLGLFAAGGFDAAGGAPASSIARIDANGIHALGASTAGLDANGAVTAVTLNGTDVFVGGQFGAVGGRVSANVARFATDEILIDGFE